MKRIRIVAVDAGGVSYVQTWQELEEGQESMQIQELKDLIVRTDLKTFYFEDVNGDFVVLRPPFTLTLQVRDRP